eukprot:m.260423 g.260423  ORF g.260423 m.260423 type:complete len:245 (+) comp19680_c0_seq3:101-835(+)
MEKPWAMEELRLKSWQKLNLAINDSNTPCSILCKAVVVSGKGYCVLFTDLSRIWWHSAMENEYSDFFKKCNNNMTYAEKKLKDFIEHKVTKFAVLNGVSWTVPLVTSSTNGTSKPEDASLDAWSVTMHDETLSTKFTISWTFHLRTLPMDSVEHCTFNHIVQPMSFMVTSLWRKLQAATHEVERQASEIEIMHPPHHKRRRRRLVCLTMPRLSSCLSIPSTQIRMPETGCRESAIRSQPQRTRY